MNVNEESATLEEALEVVRRLTAENARLREQLARLHEPQSISKPDRVVVGPVANSVGARSDSASKIALFQSLFRGRDDVYALRWEREGRSGYAPALRPGAPRGRQVVREADDYLPLTADTVRQHLMGAGTLGIYPLLRDNTCWFPAVDLDKDGWRQNVLAATPVDKDGHHPIIAMQCGPVRFRVDVKQEAEARPFDHRVLLQSTSFKLQQDDREPGIQEMCSQLAADADRTAIIVSDVGCCWRPADTLARASTMPVQGLQGHRVLGVNEARG